MKTKAYLLCEYGKEFLLAGLMCAILWQQEWLNPASKFLDESAGAWATFYGVLFAGALAAWLMLFTFNTGDFGAWLEWKGVTGVYSGAFLFNILLFMVAMVTTFIISYAKGTWLTKAGIYVVVLGLINSITLALLVYRLTRLHAVFNLEFKKATESYNTQK